MAKGEWDVVVAGGANYDYLIRGQGLPGPGETALGDTFHEGPGGKGANQAVAAARLGARVAFIARLGGDARGDWVLTQLNQEQVQTECCVRDPVTPTGVALIMVDQHGEKQIQTAPGANYQFAPADIHSAQDLLRSAKVVLTQLEVPLATVTRVLQVAKEGGAITVLDPAPAVPLPDDVLQLVDYIRPNSGEAQVLTNVAVTDVPSAREAADRLIRRGVKAVAVQAAEAGNLLVWKGGEQLFPKLKVNSIDATGAGDAFAAALAVMLAENRELTEACRFANAAAALATTVIGAQDGLPSRAAITRLLKEQTSR